MRYVLVCALLSMLSVAGIAAGGPNGEEGPPWFKQSFLDVKEDLADARKAGRGLMLYFYQDGCPYCARFLRETLARRDIADKTRRYFDVVAIDLRGDREVTDAAGKAMPEKNFAASMGVKYTPVFMMFDETGQVVLRLTGFQSPARFDAALDYVASRAFGQYPDFEQYIKVRAAMPILQGEHGGLMK
jgi:thioredoxin-related protein